MGDFPMPSTEDSGADIAIIGMSGRFPGARNVDEFWQNLCNGVEPYTYFYVVIIRRIVRKEQGKA